MTRREFAGDSAPPPGASVVVLKLKVSAHAQITRLVDGDYLEPTTRSRLQRQLSSVMNRAVVISPQRTDGKIRSDPSRTAGISEVPPPGQRDSSRQSSAVHARTLPADGITRVVSGGSMGLGRRRRA
jgi:hypothetical protein